MVCNATYGANKSNGKDGEDSSEEARSDISSVSHIFTSDDEDSQSDTSIEDNTLIAEFPVYNGEGYRTYLPINYGNTISNSWFPSQSVAAASLSQNPFYARFPPNSEIRIQPIQNTLQHDNNLISNNPPPANNESHQPTFPVPQYYITNNYFGMPGEMAFGQQFQSATPDYQMAYPSHPITPTPFQMMPMCWSVPVYQMNPIYPFHGFAQPFGPHFMSRYMHNYEMPDCQPFPFGTQESAQYFPFSSEFDEMNLQINTLDITGADFSLINPDYAALFDESTPAINNPNQVSEERKTNATNYMVPALAVLCAVVMIMFFRAKRAVNG